MNNWDQKWESHKTSKAEAWISSQRGRVLNGCLDRLKDGKKKILEIGCGSALNLKKLNKARTDVECYALDRSPVAIALAKKEFPLAFVADCDATPFEDKKFDLIYSAGVMEHLGDETAFLAEMRRILKDDGLLVTFVPARYSLWRFYQLLLFWFMGNEYEKSYTYSGLASLFSAHRFVETEFFGLDPFSVQGAIMKIFNFTFNAPIKTAPFKSAYTEICMVAKKKPG